MDSNVNLCVVGAVSAGKSMLINALFLESYSPSSKKRTTMNPTKYIETTKAIDPSAVFKEVDERNQVLIKKSESGKTKASDYKEVIYEVGKLDINIADCLFNLYDIPGLNDARTENVYYKYLADHFDKFNVVVFLVDLESGLNTSDEIKILDFIVLQTKRFPKRNIRTLVVANKADDMQLSEDGTLTFEGELKTMYAQVETTVKEKFTGILEQLIGIIPLCALDAYLYRMIRKHGSSFQLTDDQIQKIGINDQGKKFSKLKKTEQREKVAEIVQDAKFIEDMIQLSGFRQFEKMLSDHLTPSHKGDRIGNILAQLEPYNVEAEIASILKRHRDTSSVFTLGVPLSSVKERVRVYQSQIKPIDTTVYLEHMKELFTLLQKHIAPVQNEEDTLYFTKCDFIDHHPTRDFTLTKKCLITMTMMNVKAWLDSFNGFRKMIGSLGFDLDFGDQDFYTTEEKRQLYPDYDREHVWDLLKPSFPYHKCAYGLEYCITTMQTIGYLDALHVKVLVDGFFDVTVRSFNPTLPYGLFNPTIPYGLEPLDATGKHTVAQLKRLAPFLSKVENERVARHVVVNYLDFKSDFTPHEVTVRRMMYARRNETCVRLLLDMLKVVDYETIIKGWDSEYEKDPRFELDLYYLQTLETVVDLMA